MNEEIQKKLPCWYSLLEEWFKESEEKEDTKGDTHAT
jgi:hypothetical protein